MQIFNLALLVGFQDALRFLQRKVEDENLTAAGEAASTGPQGHCKQSDAWRVFGKGTCLLCGKSSAMLGYLVSTHFAQVAENILQLDEN